MERKGSMNITNDMNDLEHKLKPLHGVSLSIAEREEMKENIRLFMAEHPVQVPFFERLFSGVRVPQNTFFMHPALAGLMIVFVAGGGTSYAAADALPGDLLYPFKIHVNEGIAQALAISQEAKANQNAELAVRRLEEAETLASEGRLNSEVRADIEARFEEHAEQFEGKAAALIEKDEKIESIADAQSNLEASLRAHAAILADLSLAMPEAHTELSEIARTVTDRVRSVETARVATEHVISVKVGEGIRTAATAKKRAVERELGTARTRSPKPELPSATSDTAVMMMTVSAKSASTTPDPVTEAFEEGSARLEEGQYGEAFRTLQGASRAIRQEKLEFDAHEKFKLDVNTGSSVNTWKNGEKKDEKDDDSEAKDTEGSGDGVLPVKLER